MCWIVKYTNNGLNMVVASSGVVKLLIVLSLLLLVRLPRVLAGRPLLDTEEIRTGYSAFRSGSLSNEALPPLEESEKQKEKRLRAYEKWKTLKGLPSESSSPRGKDDKLEFDVEEFYVEHEISEPSARLEATNLHLDTIIPSPGCEECTRKEMEYCAGAQVMNDHCCCDRKYTEVFPYVPHTCYLGTIPCRPVASDCGEYKRLRACCCDKHLATKWKAILSNSSTESQPVRRLWILSWFITLYIYFTIFN